MLDKVLDSGKGDSVSRGGRLLLWTGHVQARRSHHPQQSARSTNHSHQITLRRQKSCIEGILQVASSSSLKQTASPSPSSSIPSHTTRTSFYATTTTTNNPDYKLLQRQFSVDQKSFRQHPRKSYLSRQSSLLSCGLAGAGTYRTDSPVKDIKRLLEEKKNPPVQQQQEAVDQLW